MGEGELTMGWPFNGGNDDIPDDAELDDVEEINVVETEPETTVETDADDESPSLANRSKWW